LCRPQMLCQNNKNGDLELKRIWHKYHTFIHVHNSTINVRKTMNLLRVMTQLLTVLGCGGSAMRLKWNTPPSTWLARRSITSSSSSKSSHSGGSAGNVAGVRFCFSEFTMFMCYHVSLYYIILTILIFVTCTVISKLRWKSLSCIVFHFRLICVIIPKMFKNVCKPFLRYTQKCWNKRKP